LRGYDWNEVAKGAAVEENLRWRFLLQERHIEKPLLVITLGSAIMRVRLRRGRREEVE
jgi:hypothetical protein